MPEFTITVRARLAPDDLGIAMGIGILVMFGLFEKRKNDLKNIANQLKEWDH